MPQDVHSVRRKVLWRLEKVKIRRALVAAISGRGCETDYVQRTIRVYNDKSHVKYGNLIQLMQMSSFKVAASWPIQRNKEKQ